jgi:hypothetical protein
MASTYFVAGIAVMFVLYQLKDPDPVRTCKEYCGSKGKSGQMVPSVDPALTAGMRGSGPKICKCS